MPNADDHHSMVLLVADPEGDGVGLVE